MSPTTLLRLNRGKDGYYRTSWYDDHGVRHSKSFGSVKRKAEAAFQRFHAEWRTSTAARNPDAIETTIEGAWKLFESAHRDHYTRADGTPTGELRNIQDATARLRANHGDLPASALTAGLIKALQQEMKAAGQCANHINSQIRRIRRVWKWLAQEEIVSPDVTYKLTLVKPVRATTRRKVEPVPPEHIDAILEHLTPTVRAMVLVQLWTGMRPGEVCVMRAQDIDATGDVWFYRPAHHKTAHHGVRREVAIGPHAQVELAGRMDDAGDDGYIFKPKQSRREAMNWKTEKPNSRYTPKTDRRIRPHFDTATYGRAIRRACEAAGIPPWSPNRLRHNCGQEAREKFGLDGAQVIMGHTKADTSEIYASANRDRAAEIMRQIG